MKWGMVRYMNEHELTDYLHKTTAMDYDSAVSVAKAMKQHRRTEYRERHKSVSG